MAPATDRENENYRRAVQYLVGALRKNPLEQSAEVIAGRNRLLGVKAANPLAAATATQAERKQRRAAIIKALDDLRANFWSSPLAELQTTLAKVDATDFPDLQAALARLDVVAAHRSQFPALTRYRQFDSDFFLVFKDVLVSSPKDAAIAKERMLASFATGQKRKRGQKMIKLLAVQMPEVYNLEASWLDTLARQRASTSRKHSTPVLQTNSGISTVFEASGNIPWWLIPVGILLIRLLISASK